MKTKKSWDQFPIPTGSFQLNKKSCTHSTSQLFDELQTPDESSKASTKMTSSRRCWFKCCSMKV
ncbi:hypothetical protein GIB67_011166 [Kingdonia uniflora]|uniref:Uncharacterized protein n=1 Tax=Kingdonia uniflora TaxID=39325 RepID=A0A7J7PAC5_9MAGN|nr:hypothetical protein GIB67_009239 [Kingdonia uniflora]KAF6142433.1 hypothetical protein GIB67_009240 [Kingdonia uniflora]KAF6176377.1 hypothetical protein GIB67_011166 [Kingdonia uniflora]